MKQIVQLTKRNCMIYIRNKGAVFSSMLTMMIVIALMLIFLGDMNVNGIVSGFFGNDAPDEVRRNAESYVFWWTVAGVLSVNSLMVVLTVLTPMIADSENGIIQSFYTSPIKRWKISAGYVTSAWVCSSAFAVLTMLGAVIIAAVKGFDITFKDVVISVLYASANAFMYAGMMYLIAVLTKSLSAYSGLGTTIGTLCGFLGGIYLPAGSLPDGVLSVLKCLPVLHGTALIRQPLTDAPQSTLFFGLPAEFSEELEDVMGVRISFGEHILNSQTELAILFISGIIFLGVGAVVLKRKTDR
ncbi:MAG: ABC transporter permease [Ruminococcus sp.]|nr:ABC transporter permease [Ruminococcus sp.]